MMTACPLQHVCPRHTPALRARVAWELAQQGCRVGGGGEGESRRLWAGPAAAPLLPGECWEVSGWVGLDQIDFESVWAIAFVETC